MTEETSIDLRLEAVRVALGGTEILATPDQKDGEIVYSVTKDGGHVTGTLVDLENQAKINEEPKQETVDETVIADEAAPATHST